jgi:hypothetical protein
MRTSPEHVQAVEDALSEVIVLGHHPHGDQGSTREGARVRPTGNAEALEKLVYPPATALGHKGPDGVHGPLAPKRYMEVIGGATDAAMGSRSDLVGQGRGRLVRPLLEPLSLLDLHGGKFTPAVKA